MIFTRRNWILACAAALSPGARATAGVSVRGYRIHATITLLSVPLFSRKDVGGGAILAESGAGSQGVSTGLQLVAGSFPERAHKLNRFGFIQELVEENLEGVPSLSFFGFMTTSTEKNLSDAKQALAADGTGVSITAIQGASKNGRLECRVARSHVPESLGWRECKKLLPAVRAFFHSRDVEDSTVPAGAGVHTFLYTVRQAMISSSPSLTARFVYQGKLYRLDCQKRAEDKLVRLAATIEQLDTREKSSFRVWYRPQEPGAPPVRIEFQARAFLRLVFEHEPAAHGGVLTPSLSA